MKHDYAHHAPTGGWGDAHEKWRIYVAAVLKPIVQELQRSAAFQGTPRISEQMSCYGCERHLGTSAFDRKAVYNFRQRPTQRPPTCYTCQERLAIIQRRMDARHAWRCTCVESTNRDSKYGRYHVPSNEKCQLYSKRIGERRWPGGNNNVTKGDYNWWRRLQNYQDRNAAPPQLLVTSDPEPVPVARRGQKRHRS